MKKTLKLTLTVALLLCSTSLFAQKIGRINLDEIIQAMPETKEMMTKMEAIRKDWANQYEVIQVEYNQKMNDLQKGTATLTDAQKQMKETELRDIINRLQQFEQMAGEDMQKKQMELLEPIQKKATDALNKVAAAQGFAAVLHSGIIAYVNEAQIPDLAPAVKKELGIQ